MCDIMSHGPVEATLWVYSDFMNYRGGASCPLPCTHVCPHPGQRKPIIRTATWVYLVFSVGAQRIRDVWGRFLSHLSLSPDAVAHLSADCVLCVCLVLS